MAKRTDYPEFYDDLIEQTQDYNGEKEDIVRLAPELFRFLTNLQNNKKCTAPWASWTTFSSVCTL